LIAQVLAQQRLRNPLHFREVRGGLRFRAHVPDVEQGRNDFEEAVRHGACLRRADGAGTQEHLGQDFGPMLEILLLKALKIG
jgi:hypothetical protein